MVGLKDGVGAYEWAKLDTLKHHPDNPRKGNVDVIRESLRANGIIRPIVVSRRTSHVLAGNHTLKAARAEGLGALPVVWLDDLTPAQERKVLLADNRTSDLGTYDAEVLAAVLGQMQAEDELLGTGYSDADVEALLSGEMDSANQTASEAPPSAETPYTNKIVSPVYEPTGRRPDLADLVDTAKYDELSAKINADPTLDAETRRFLLLAASRHIVFRFANIAEFYCHAPQPLQHHMESSALVIIDYGRAVEEGFVALTEALGALADEEGPT